MKGYFFANGNQQRGPYTLEEMASFGLRPDTLVWHERLTEWQRADALAELTAMIATAQQAKAPAVSQHDGAPAQPQLNYQTNFVVPTDGMAVASLVLGLVSVPALCANGLGVIPAILAIVFGFLARGRIRRGQSSGAGMALAGLILGFISAGLVIVFFVIVAIGYAWMK